MALYNVIQAERGKNLRALRNMPKRDETFFPNELIFSFHESVGSI